MRERWNFISDAFRVQAVFVDGVCESPPPELWFMAGWPRQHCTGYARAIGWDYGIVPDYGPEMFFDAERSRFIVPGRDGKIAKQGSDTAAG